MHGDDRSILLLDDHPEKGDWLAPGASGCEAEQGMQGMGDSFRLLITAQGPEQGT